MEVVVTAYISLILSLFVLNTIFVYALSRVVSSGLVPLCSGFWLAIGQYGMAIMTTRLRLAWSISLPLSVIAGVAVSAVVFAPIRRLSGTTFTFYSLALQVAVASMLRAGWQVTGGSHGLAVVTAAPYAAVMIAAVIAGGFAVICNRAAVRVVIDAAGDDEIQAAALGINVPRTRWMLLVIAGAAGALAGALSTSLIAFVDPMGSSLDISIMALVGVCVFGWTNIGRLAAGSAFMTLFPEVIRAIRVMTSARAELRYWLLGCALLVVMLTRRDAILPREVRTNDRYY